jgi:hypothetical protein
MAKAERRASAASPPGCTTPRGTRTPTTSAPATRRRPTTRRPPAPSCPPRAARASSSLSRPPGEGEERRQDVRVRVRRIWDRAETGMDCRSGKIPMARGWEVGQKAEGEEDGERSCGCGLGEDPL